MKDRKPSEGATPTEILAQGLFSEIDGITRDAHLWRGPIPPGFHMTSDYDGRWIIYYDFTVRGRKIALHMSPLEQRYLASSGLRGSRGFHVYLGPRYNYERASNEDDLFGYYDVSDVEVHKSFGVRLVRAYTGGRVETPDNDDHALGQEHIAFIRQATRSLGSALEQAGTIRPSRP